MCFDLYCELDNCNYNQIHGNLDYCRVQSHESVMFKIQIWHVAEMPGKTMVRKLSWQSVCLLSCGQTKIGNSDFKKSIFKQQKKRKLQKNGN